MTRSHASTVTETKENTERNLGNRGKNPRSSQGFRPLTLGGRALGSRGGHPEVAQGHPVGYGHLGKPTGVTEDFGQHAHARYAASNTCSRKCSGSSESPGATATTACPEPDQPYTCREQRTWRRLGDQWAHSRSHAGPSATDPAHDGWPRGGRIQLNHLILLTCCTLPSSFVWWSYAGSEPHLGHLILLMPLGIRQHEPCTALGRLCTFSHCLRCFPCYWTALDMLHCLMMHCKSPLLSVRKRRLRAWLSEPCEY